MSEDPKFVKGWLTKAGLPGIIRDVGVAYCGYVGVGPEHPAYERGYDHPIVSSIEVLGGLGYADRLDSKGWWFGFDSAHTSGGIFGMADAETRANVLRDVEKNVELLAVQLADRASLPRAMAYEKDGKVVLDDPDALAMIHGINKYYCAESFRLNKERVEYFVGRMREGGKSPKEWLIVVINASDPNGSLLAELLMPGNGPVWQEMLTKGQIPFARGLAGREGITEILKEFDQDAWKKLRLMDEGIPVVVVDHGVAEIFEAPPGPNIYGRDLDLSAAKEINK